MSEDTIAELFHATGLQFRPHRKGFVTHDGIVYFRPHDWGGGWTCRVNTTSRYGDTMRKAYLSALRAAVPRAETVLKLPGRGE